MQSQPIKLKEILKMRSERPEEPPKFLRDSMKIEDINGTRSKPLYSGVARSILNVKDISGT